MALPIQIDAAARKPKPVHSYEPVNINRVDIVPDANPGDFPDAREFVKRLGNRHDCNGVGCRRRGHKADIEATNRALIILGLADDPYPSVERPRDISSTVERPVREGGRAHLARLKARLAGPHTDASWQDDARCRGDDPELFFGPDGERLFERERREREAKKVCKTCPVIQQCLDGAIARNEKAGVWAGLTAGELAAERRRRMRQAAA